MKRKALWNQIIENLEALLDAPDMDCDCDDCAVARHIMKRNTIFQKTLMCPKDIP